MQVVSFNMRYATANDGAHSFYRRKNLILETIKSYLPDIIGFQEVMPHVQQWLTRELDAYTVVGVSRSERLTDESCPIAFRKERFQLLHMQTFWLSTEPNKAGSRYAEQSDCPRLATVIYLQDVVMGKVFRVYNVHLDHEFASARAAGLQDLIANMERDSVINLPHQEQIPMILLGDFNQNMPENFKISNKNQDILFNLTAKLPATMHNFQGEACTNAVKIDHIFASKPWVASDAMRWLEAGNGTYLSDHYPISVCLHWGE